MNLVKGKAHGEVDKKNYLEILVSRSVRRVISGGGISLGLEESTGIINN